MDDMTLPAVGPVSQTVLDLVDIVVVDLPYVNLVDSFNVDVVDLFVVSQPNVDFMHVVAVGVNVMDLLAVNIGNMVAVGLTAIDPGTYWVRASYICPPWISHPNTVYLSINQNLSDYVETWLIFLPITGYLIMLKYG